MTTENKKQYRKLRRFVQKLGIKSAETIDDVILDLMEALEVGMYSGGKPDQVFMGAAAFESLEKTLSKVTFDPSKLKK